MTTEKSFANRWLQRLARKKASREGWPWLISSELPRLVSSPYRRLAFRRQLSLSSPVLL